MALFHQSSTQADLFDTTTINEISVYEQIRCHSESCTLIRELKLQILVDWSNYPIFVQSNTIWSYLVYNFANLE